MSAPWPVMNRRQWHIAFCAAAGARVTARMNDADDAEMNRLRDRGTTAMYAAKVIRERVEARHGTIR